MADTLSNLETQAERVLFTCRTVFPFTIFPTYMELTPSRLTIKRMILPFTFHTTPVFIKDLAYVRLSENPFFATISFEMIMTPEEPHPVRFLHPADAKKMEELLVGCMEAIKKNYNPSAVQVPRARLKKIGETKKI
jgi:hypothetical protein